MKEELKAGDKLTCNGLILTIGGMIIMNKGDVVTVKEAVYSKGFWSRMGCDWIPEKLFEIKLVEHYGCWNPSTFYETQTTNP